MNLYKLETPVLLKFNRIKRLVFILCFLFAKPTSKSYKLFHKTLRRIFQCKKTFNVKTRLNLGQTLGLCKKAMLPTAFENFSFKPGKNIGIFLKVRLGMLASNLDLLDSIAIVYH